MKTKTIAAATLVALLLAVVSTAALASPGHSAAPLARGQSDSSRGIEGHHRHGAACSNLTVGETFTVSGLAGHFANASDRDKRGNASGTFSFKVSAIYAEGCTLSITGGSFKLGSNTYTVTGGSIVLNHGGRFGEGSGTTSAGSFLIFIAGLHGNSKSANVGAVRFDFETGKSQFLVNLHSPAAVGEAGESE